MRIAAVQAQEPMSGVTVVVDGTGSAEVARCVIESSRALYAKTIQHETPDTKPVSALVKPVDVNKKPSTTRKTRTSHVAKKASDELSQIKPAT